MSHPVLPSSTAREAFYAAAWLGLHALDRRERTPRRFGADADTRWQQFRGALTPGDRVDLLLRDAAGTWGAAFSPAEVFGLFGLPPDEPFGPDWPALSAAEVRKLQPSGPQPSDELAAAAQALGIAAPLAAPVALPAISLSTHLIVAGGAAILAVGQRFAAEPALSWSDQVIVVAELPAQRQLAGLAAVLVGARARTRLLRPTADLATALPQAGSGPPDAAVVSDDADDASARFAASASGGR